MAKDKLKEEKMHERLIYFQEKIVTWRSNRMEIGKQIMTLSALAIGLLATFRSEIDDCFSFLCWILAGLSFIISMWLILRIFHQNSDYIEQTHNNDKEKAMETKQSLQYKEYFAEWLFGVGVALTCILVAYRVGLPF